MTDIGKPVKEYEIVPDEEPVPGTEPPPDLPIEVVPRRELQPA